MQYLLSKEEYDNLINAKELAEEKVRAEIKAVIDQRLKELRAEARQQLISFSSIYCRNEMLTASHPLKMLAEKFGDLFERFSHLPDKS